MEKVWNPNENDLKIIKLLYENREGLRYTSIMKWGSLKQSVVYKRLNILKDKGLIENEFPVWKIANGGVSFCRKLLKSDNIFELHNIGYIIRLIKIPEWWNPKGTQMKNKLMRVKNYQFKRVDWGKNNSNPYIQLKSDKYVIQMYPESIIIIHRKRYYSNDPYDTAMQFLNDFYDLWEWFEERMKFKFFLDGIPQMTLRGNDYNRLNDFLANKVREEESRFLVEIGDGRKVWVDMSEPFGKEANTPELQVIMEKVVKDRAIHPNSLLPSELTKIGAETQQGLKILTDVVSYNQELLKDLPKNIQLLAAQIGSHLKLIQEYRKENTKWRKSKVKEIREDLKHGKQTKITDF